MATNSNLKCHDIFEINAKGQYPLGAKFNNDYLTKREIDVIKCILQGYSAKKVGLSLGISFRTVESYINMIKLKLKCSRKSELIELCMRSGLYKVFF